MGTFDKYSSEEKALMRERDPIEADWGENGRLTWLAWTSLLAKESDGEAVKKTESLRPLSPLAIPPLSARGRVSVRTTRAILSQRLHATKGHRPGWVCNFIGNSRWCRVLGLMHVCSIRADSRRVGTMTTFGRCIQFRLQCVLIEITNKIE